MARKRTAEELPTLFDLSTFETQVKAKHPDDVDTSSDSAIPWNPKPQLPEIELKVGDWVKHKHKDAAGIITEIQDAGTSVLGSKLIFCRVDWKVGNSGGYPEYKYLPGELELTERPDFLCNSFDGDNPKTLHKKNGPENFLCNNSEPPGVETLHKKIGQICDAIDTLDISPLYDLLIYIRARIDRPRETELDIPVRSDREVVDRRRVGSIVYQLERVKCGKNCRKCPHGPYWYAYYRRGGKLSSKYIGKNLPG